MLPGTWKSPLKILRMSEVMGMTGLSRVTLWRLERDGRFPARLQLSKNAVGWRDDEVMDWVQSRPRVARRAAEAASSAGPKP